MLLMMGAPAPVHTQQQGQMQRQMQQQMQRQMQEHMDQMSGPLGEAVQTMERLTQRVRAQQPGSN